jgi:hypothetical protein
VKSLTLLLLGALRQPFSERQPLPWETEKLPTTVPRACSADDLCALALPSVRDWHARG